MSIRWRFRPRVGLLGLCVVCGFPLLLPLWGVVMQHEGNGSALRGVVGVVGVAGRGHSWCCCSLSTPGELSLKLAAVHSALCKFCMLETFCTVLAQRLQGAYAHSPGGRQCVCVDELPGAGWHRHRHIRFGQDIPM